MEAINKYRDVMKISWTEDALYDSLGEVGDISARDNQHMRLAMKEFAKHLNKFEMKYQTRFENRDLSMKDFQETLEKLRRHKLFISKYIITIETMNEQCRKEFEKMNIKPCSQKYISGKVFKKEYKEFEHNYNTFSEFLRNNGHKEISKNIVVPESYYEEKEVELFVFRIYTGDNSEFMKEFKSSGLYDNTMSELYKYGKIPE